jgi:hypothetical protein
MENWLCTKCNVNTRCAQHEKEAFWKDAFRCLTFGGGVAEGERLRDWLRGYSQILSGYKTNPRDYYFEVKVNSKTGGNAPTNFHYMLHRILCLECSHVYTGSTHPCRPDLESAVHYICFHMDNNARMSSHLIPSREFNRELASPNPLLVINS